MESKKWPSLLGPAHFIDWIKGRYYARKLDDEVPQAKELAPAKDQIISAVCGFYKVGIDDLFKSQRGVFNEPRNAAVYLIRKLRHDSLQEICDQFQMKKYSSVSSIIERMKVRMLTDRKLKKRIDELCLKAKKRQEQT